MDNLAGQEVKGYELQERIAAGGFGAVYRAYQSTVGREVAVKVILPSLANKPDFIRRFEAEAQLIARLEHPFIVPLHDYWRDPNGAYLVMRYLRGGSLHDHISKKGSLSIEETVNLFSQIAQGLHVAHRNQVIHRDIKPGNILLDEDGNGYLADFGIAKDHTTTENITEPDSFIGSPEYLAPEQARSETVTPQTDIYSLGVVLYEMLIGEHPFPGLEKIAVIFKHLNEVLPEITTLEDSICDEINTVIRKATAKNPAQRYGDVLEMLQSLRDAAKLDLTSSPTSIVELLTPREQEVMQLIIDGKSNREIADLLVLAEATVKSYIKSIYRKLKVRSRVQAIARARDLDFLIRKPETSACISTGHLPEPDNPYKGLRAFQAADAQDYFGREKMTQKLLSRLQDNRQQFRFLALVGPSGSGKSSLAKAGLIPSLWRGDLPHSENWYIVDFIPGNRPLDELEVALLRVAGEHSLNLREQLERDKQGLLRTAKLILPDDESELLLVIDQFEEVFTLLEDESERLHFLTLIQEAVTDKRSRVRVIVTLRADYYDRPLQYPEFGALMQTRLETVLPLSAEELERAISEPAYRVGVHFEDGLVSRIVSDVHYQPGALPLLQYALTELFERRDGRILTLEAYQAIGGTGGALAKRADEIYMEGNDEGRELVRQLFLRLVTLGEGAEDTRRRVKRAELLEVTNDPELMDEIIDLYTVSRLLSLDNDPSSRQPTVEVAHEAILREWERLRQWLNESRDDIKQERQVAQAAEAWQGQYRDKSYILRGTRLEQVEKWQDMTDLALTPLVREFITVSIEQRQIEEKVEAERQAREEAQEQRSRSLLRALVAVFAVAAILSGGFGVFALYQRNEAMVERDRAQRQADVNHSLVLANTAQTEADNANVDLGLLLALNAVSIEDPPAAAIRALETVALNFGTRAILRESVPGDNANRVHSVAFSPDARLAISGGCAEVVDTACRASEFILWDIQTASEIRRFEGPSDWLNSVMFGSDGQTIFAAYGDGSIIAWDLNSGELVQHFRGHASSVNDIALSPDGATIVSASSDKTVLLWDVSSAEIIRRFEGHTAAVNRVAFSLDGQMIASGSGDKTIILWNLETGEPIRQLTDHVTSVTALAFYQGQEETGTLLSIAETDLHKWNLETGVTQQQFDLPCSAHDLALTPDGHTMVLDMCQTPELHNSEDLRRISHADGPSEVIAVAVSPDGRYVLSGFADGALILYNMPFSSEIRQFEADVPLATVDISPDGRYLLTGAYTSGIAILWDTESGHEIRRFGGQADAVMVTGFNHAGTQAVIGSGDFWGNTTDRRLVLLDMETFEEIPLDGHEFGVRNYAFSPDDRWLLTSSVMFGAGFVDAEYADRGELILWDAQSGELVRRFEDTKGIYTIWFTPDAHLAYTGSVMEPDIVRIWDVATGQEISHLDIGGFATLITGMDEGTLLADMHLIDLKTGDIIRSFQGHSGGVLGVDISPNGHYLISGDTTGDVILWDFATGEEIRRFAGHSAVVWNTVFRPNEQSAFSAAYDGVVREWRIADWSLEELLAWVQENRYIREFTCKERKIYQIEPYCEVEEGQGTLNSN